MMRRNERGSVTLWAVIITTAVLMIVGLVVDGGSQLRATQRADQVAREAARAAGQAISGDPILGRPGLVDVSRGRQAAAAYLSAAGVAGDVHVEGTTITVDTRVSWSPVILSAIGVGSVTVTGSAQAETKQVYQGAPR
ncbi:TadE family protein [Tessaracoccus lubricantis]